MVLFDNEKTELKELRKLSKKHNIPVRQIKGTANVEFDKDVYAQLGTGRATGIMNARINVNKKRGYKYY